MTGYVAKDVAFGKVFKSLKIGKRAVSLAKKIFKSKVVQKAIQKASSSSHGRTSTHKISNGAGSKGAAEAITAPTNRNGLLAAMKKLGPKPFEGAEAHHMLPWKYREWFAGKGLNVNLPEYGVWVRGGGSGGHQSWSYSYDKAWENFITSYPNANKEQVIKFMNEIRENPRWDGGF